MNAGEWTGQKIHVWALQTWLQFTVYFPWQKQVWMQCVWDTEAQLSLYCVCQCGRVRYGKKFNVLLKSTFRKTFECLCYVIGLLVNGIIMGPVCASLKIWCSTVCGIYVTEEKGERVRINFLWQSRANVTAGGEWEGWWREVWRRWRYLSSDIMHITGAHSLQEQPAK